jgi:hypothetical protein
VTQLKSGPNSLRARIASGRSPLFVEDHFHLNEYHPPLNDGVSLEETVVALRKCRQVMNDALKIPSDETLKAKLAEDDKNLRYAENMVRFYYDLALAVDAERQGDAPKAREHFLAAVVSAQGLKAETDIIKTADQATNARDGLDATGLENRYRELARRLGVSLQTGGR